MAVWTLTLVNKEDSSGEEKVNEQQILAADFPSPFLSHLSDNPSAKLSNSLGDSQYQKYSWDFSAGPVVKTPHFHCKGCGCQPSQELRSGMSRGGQRKEYTLILFHSSPNIRSEFSSTLFASHTSTPFPFTHQNHTLYLDLDAHLLTRAWPNKEAG